jgi:hypothetical protein
MLTVLLATLFAQVGQPSPQKLVGAVRLESAIYFADGDVTGDSRPLLLVVGRPLTADLTAGRTLCDARSRDQAARPSPGYGWRIDLNLLRAQADGSVTIHAVWQRLWERGQATKGASNSADLTLSPGGHILLDFLGRGDSADDRQCGAIGMGLEVRAPPPDPDSLPVFEAELWLVRTLPGQVEEAQHQIIRVRAGSSADYIFDEVSMPAGRPSRVWVAGGLGQIQFVDGKIAAEIFVRETYAVVGTGIRGSGSRTYRLASPAGEVNSFELPPQRPVGRSEGPDPSGSLSLRIRLRQVR